MKKMKHWILTILMLFGMCAVPAMAYIVKGSGEDIRKKLKDKVLDDWFYEDIQGALREAKKTGKPLLVNFR